MSSCCVLVNSFDGYSDLWPVFFAIFDKYWPDCTFKSYLVSNEKGFDHANTLTIRTGKEINWSNRTLNALRKINEDFVLFLLEDYFMSKRIVNDDIEKIVCTMKENDIFYYRLSKRSGFKYSNSLASSVPQNMEYSINLQPAIWNRKALIKLLEQNPLIKSPWDFENTMNTLHLEEKSKKNIPGIMYDSRDLLGYKNGVLRGRWIPSTIKFYKKRGFMIDTSARGALSKKVWRRYCLAEYIEHHFPRFLKKSLKFLTKKFGVKYI